MSRICHWWLSAVKDGLDSVKVKLRVWNIIVGLQREGADTDLLGGAVASKWSGCVCMLLRRGLPAGQLCTHLNTMAEEGALHSYRGLSATALTCTTHMAAPAHWN